MPSYKDPDPYFEAPVEGTKMALCRQCRCIKPTTEFKAFHTGARAASLGYSTFSRVQYDSVLCRQCRKASQRDTKKHPYTARELHNRVQNNDVREAVAAEMLARRSLKARAKMSDAQEQRWIDTYTQLWSPVLDPLFKELHRNAQVKKYLKHPPPNAKLREDGKPVDYDNRMLFCEVYGTQMRALRDRIKQDWILLSGERRRPTSLHWVDYLPTETWHTLMTLWERIDLDVKVRLRAPDLLTRHGEARPDDTDHDMLRR